MQNRGSINAQIAIGNPISVETYCVPMLYLSPSPVDGCSTHPDNTPHCHSSILTQCFCTHFMNWQFINPTHAWVFIGYRAEQSTKQIPKTGQRKDTLLVQAAASDINVDVGVSGGWLLCCRDLQQQVGISAAARLVHGLKAIWSREMPPYKYMLLDCFSCLATVGPDLTSDPNAPPLAPPTLPSW